MVALFAAVVVVAVNSTATPANIRLVDSGDSGDSGNSGNSGNTGSMGGPDLCSVIETEIDFPWRSESYTESCSSVPPSYAPGLCTYDVYDNFLQYDYQVQSYCTNV